MGIYDRDYYRRETSYVGAWANQNRVTTTLILINVGAFILQLVDHFGTPPWGRDAFTNALLIDSDRILHGEVWRLVTGAFLHSTDGFAHILFNMLCLGFFGPAIERVYGSKEFLAFYLASAVLAGAGYVVAYLMGVTGSGRALGASGAVTAVLVLYAMHWPHNTVYLMLILPVPVWLVVVLQVAQDVLGVFGGSSKPVAFAAHLSGALFGFLYHRRQWRVLNWVPSLSRPGQKRARRGPPLKVFREPEEESTPEPIPLPASLAPAGRKPDVDEHLEAKLDQVLEKVAKHGQDSLTDSEREILFRASEVYKRRRK